MPPVHTHFHAHFDYTQFCPPHDSLLTQVPG